jgi:MerR family redox-sensitive transcriptional activator SoxR
MSEQQYSISQVAKSFNVTVPTLRYYEDEGLIEATSRRARVRFYDHAQLLRLAYALMWHRDAGMTIYETREIMRTTRTVDRHRLIHEQIAAVDDRISQLEEARTVLTHLLVCPADDPTNCPHTGMALNRKVDSALGDM